MDAPSPGVTVFRFPWSTAAAPPAGPHLAPTPEGWRYENPRTGVIARIADGALETPLPRPSFAGHELAEALALPPEFLAAWSAQNREATARLHAATEANLARGAVQEARGAPRLAPAAGLAWWRYVEGKNALRLAWPSVDIVLLDLFLLARRTTGEVARVLVWPERVASLVLPEAADFVVFRSAAPARGNPSPPGLVPLAPLLDELGETVRRFETPLPHWRYRGGAAHVFLVRTAQRLAVSPASEFAVVRPDEVVDG